jgi:hypothetical protein
MVVLALLAREFGGIFSHEKAQKSQKKNSHRDHREDREI